MKERWAESVEHQAVSHEKECYIQTRRQKENRNTVTPGLDNTRLFIGLTAGAGTRCMSLLSSSPSLRRLMKEMKKREDMHLVHQEADVGTGRIRA